MKQQLRDVLQTVPEKCFACDDFGKEGELWYRRTGCGIWVREECSGWDSPDGYLGDIASRRSSFPKIVYINKIQYRILSVAEYPVFVV